MAFTGDHFCTSFKVQLFLAEHDFAVAGDQFNMALYDDTSTLTAATTAYTASGELADAGNYLAKGQALTNIVPTSDGTTAICDFEDEVWSTATFSAMGALIFNEDHALPDASCIVLDFVTLQTATAGDFTVQMPAAAAATAIIRIA